MPLVLIGLGFVGGLWARSEFDTNGGWGDLVLPVAVVGGGLYAAKKTGVI